MVNFNNDLLSDLMNEEFDLTDYGGESDNSDGTSFIKNQSVIDSMIKESINLEHRNYSNIEF